MSRTWRWFVAVLALLSLTSLSPAMGAAVQKERGWALTPLPGRVAGLRIEGCPGVVHASSAWATGRSIRYRFAVAGFTLGKPFSLKPRIPVSNLDISFRTAGGTWTTYASKALNGEYGKVPNGAVEAFVCLSVGIPTQFRYRAG
jgi:hypothetical protein